MPITAHNITTKRDIVKPLQWVTEGDSVSTPSLYGVTPTSSPAFAIAGHNIDFDLTLDIKDLNTEVLGSEDVVDAVKTEELFAFKVGYELIDTTLLNYGIAASGGGAGTIDESLSFAFSEYLDGTQYYTLMKGCRPTSTTLSLERGKWMVDQTYICSDIIQPISTANAGLTTPTWVSISTSSPLTHSTAGPFTWNSVTYPESKFSCTITREMAVMAQNGQTKITYCKAGARRINFSIDAFVKNVDLETDFRAKTLRTASYVIKNTATTKTLSFVNCVIKNLQKSRSATSSDAYRDTLDVQAESVSIT